MLNVSNCTLLRDDEVLKIRGGRGYIELVLNEVDPVTHKIIDKGYCKAVRLDEHAIKHVNTILHKGTVYLIECLVSDLRRLT